MSIITNICSYLHRDDSTNFLIMLVTIIMLLFILINLSFVNTLINDNLLNRGTKCFLPSRYREIALSILASVCNKSNFTERFVQFEVIKLFLENQGLEKDV